MLFYVNDHKDYGSWTEKDLFVVVAFTLLKPSVRLDLKQLVGNCK